VILRVKLLDTTSTTGGGKTGLTSTSSGLIISTIADVEATATAYTAAGSTIESITTLGTFAAPTATKCRFKEVDSTNHKGLYEIQIADARWAVSNARSVIVSIQCTGAAEVDAEVQLSAFDPNDSVRGGLTALPAVAAGATNGLPLSVDSSGRVAVGTNNDKTGYALTSGYDPAKTAAQAGDAMALTSGERTTLSGVIWATLTSALTAAGSIGKLLVDRIDALISSRLASGSYTAPLDAAGTRSALGLASANLDSQIAGLQADADDIQTRLPAALVGGRMDSSVGAMAVSVTASTVSDKTGYSLTSAYDPATTAAQAGDAMTLTSAYDPAKTAAQAGDAMTLDPAYDAAKTAAQAGDSMSLTTAERDAAADVILARAIAAESYAADGGTPTLSQILWMIWSGLVDYSISGTVLTVKKQDGSAAMTFDLDDPTAPTSRTRAT
jgi:hypothetical protein